MQISKYDEFVAFLSKKDDLSDKLKDELIRVFSKGQEDAFERGKAEGKRSK